MSWSYETRMTRVINNLINTSRIERVDVYKRAKFFGQYAFRVNLGISLNQWVKFDELMQQYRNVFDPMGGHIVGLKSTFEVYVYGNNPEILTWLYRHPSISILSLVQTDPTCWHKPLPKAKKNVGKFFGEYRFRVRMRDELWGGKQANVDQLDELEMDHKLVLRKWPHSVSTPNVAPLAQIRDTFIYLKKVNEVLVLKLMFADQIADVEERN